MPLPMQGTSSARRIRLGRGEVDAVPLSADEFILHSAGGMTLRGSLLLPLSRLALQHVLDHLLGL